ncbi:nitroreductase family protein [Candidatus Chlorohelix sp.]|uniref:nitroreductase family protein n=1 Tax=Candidatus Chlorohelix sp. TaxID=3139201 RepID=UPI00303D313D
MTKLAETSYAIHEILANRWSPRAFSSQPVEEEKLLSLFEAARWSPSGGNSQPWSFIVGTQSDPETHQKIFDVLVPGNQAWNKDVPVLVLSVAKVSLQPGKPYRWALYDVGQAVAHLTVQAGAFGLYVHQMAGFDSEKAQQVFQIPEGYEVVTAIAIGYPGDADQLPEPLRERELAPRTRKPLSEFVFKGSWNQPLKLPASEI